MQATVLLFMLLLVHLVAAGGTTAPGQARLQASNGAPTKLSGATETFANCRYGVTAGVNEVQAIPNLGAGTFYQFSSPYWSGPLPDNGAELLHLIKTHQEKSGGMYLPAYTTNVPLDDALGNYIRNHPGDLWIVGNEVDRGPSPGQTTGGQGDMFPDMYAEAYHDVYYFIKSYDPTARVVNSGLVEVTPGRLQYLDKMWNAYMAKYGSPMPVDAWSMHIYILPEVEPDGTPNGIANVAVGTDASLGKRGSGAVPNHCSDSDVYCYAEHDNISIFAEQVVAMRQWMKQHGQQQKPLMLTEFSILYPYKLDGNTCEYLKDEFGNCFTPERVSTFMVNAFNYLNGARNSDLGYARDNHRLVQNWSWFEVYASVFDDSSSDLVLSDRSTLTMMGQTFRNHIYAEPVARNLKVDQVPGVTATIGADDKATARLVVRFLNDGNTAVTSPFNVTFYSDAARTKPIGTATVSPLVRGCALSSHVAAVNWSGLTPGAYQFWVTLDSSDAINESSPGNDDNHGTGFVLVNTDRVLLPMLRR